MDSWILFFSLLFTLEGGRSLPVDRKRNIAAHFIESLDDNYEKESFDIQGKDTSESVEQFILSTFEENNEDYESESELSIYESIKHENISILTKIERLYNAFKTYTANHDRHHPHEIPLLSIVTTEPHSMTVRITPKKLEPDSLIHLQYERVPMHREPAMEHLDDPVQEYIPLIRTSQTFSFSSLPRGKYIVCGEALGKMGDVYQESCLETRIRKREGKGLQSGVQALIVISMVMVVAVIVYAILVQVCKKVFGSPPDKR